MPLSIDCLLKMLDPRAWTFGCNLARDETRLELLTQEILKKSRYALQGLIFPPTPV